MPVENEFKFILKDHDALLRDLSLHHERLEIDQIYLDGGGRFRRITSNDNRDFLYPKCVFTYKFQSQGKQIEIETKISEDDFYFAEQVATSRLSKFRFDFHENQTHWDIDFIKDPDGMVYFAMAEAEVDEGVDYEIPEWLNAHILTEIPQIHNHIFSNIRLTDPEYARNVASNYQIECSLGVCLK